MSYTAYDSSGDTRRHIEVVKSLLSVIIDELQNRAISHDASKLCDPEKATFDEFTLHLKASTYGSQEYQQVLREMSSALDHHYAANSHHPEHYQNGIDGMDLIDIVEMLADWKAATLRHADGDLRKSITINASRFRLSDQLVGILLNTAQRLGLIEPLPLATP